MLFYIGDQYRVSRMTVSSLVMAVPKVIDETLQGIKHGGSRTEDIETAIALVGEVVAIELANRRR